MNSIIKPPPQTGSYAPNPHEGARSEYLAQYVFSSFGTSLPVQFSPDDLLDDSRFAQYRQVLHYWVLCDQANVRRYQMGMRSLTTPGLYTTNEVSAAATGRYYLHYPTPEIRANHLQLC